MTGERVAGHVDRFNAAVRSGQWSGFVAAFTDNAVVTFAGVPVGPFHGRDEIAAA